MSPTGRPEGEGRIAQHESSPVREPLRYRSSRGRLDNMSAPPRSKVTIRPLRAPATTNGSDAGPDPMRLPGACNLRLVSRVRLDELITVTIPRTLANSWTPATKATGIDPNLTREYRRLLASVVLARRVTGEPQAGYAAIRAAAGQPQEALEDELFARVRQLDGRRLGLPAYGFIRHYPEWGCFLKVPAETDIARALYISTHCYGQSFLRDADPLPLNHVASGMLDLVSTNEGGPR